MKRSFIIILFLLFAPFVYAQDTLKNLNQPGRFYVGGNIGLQVGSFTNIDISPLIGYKITKGLSAGVGLTYQYTSFSGRGGSNYGGRLFVRQFIFRSLFAQTEYESLSVKTSRLNESSMIIEERKGINAYLVGLGYRQTLGDRAGVEFTLSYNFLETVDTPAKNPVFKVGFVLGL